MFDLEQFIQIEIQIETKNILTDFIRLPVDLKYLLPLHDGAARETEVLGRHLLCSKTPPSERGQ